MEADLLNLRLGMANANATEGNLCPRREEPVKAMQTRGEICRFGGMDTWRAEDRLVQGRPCEYIAARFSRRFFGLILHCNSGRKDLRAISGELTARYLFACTSLA
jgi:hypothetical protein